MKRIAGATATLVILGVLAAPALAQEPYPIKKTTCGVSDTQLAPGDSVTVSGDKWEPGSVVDITLEPEGIDLGSANVGAGGSFSTTVTIPSSVEAGPHRIVCSGTNVDAVSVTSDSNIQVLGAVVPGGPAFTGPQSNVPLLVAIAVILALAGVVALVIGSRRRSKTTVASG